MKALMILICVTAPAQAQAADLWCMPTEICRNGVCKPTDDTELSVRLHKPDGKNPVLRSHAESIAMTKILDTEMQQWSGTNAGGGDEILAVLLSDMSFAYVDANEDRSQINRATGLCEVQ